MSLPTAHMVLNCMVVSLLCWVTVWEGFFIIIPFYSFCNSLGYIPLALLEGLFSLDFSRLHCLSFLTFANSFYCDHTYTASKKHTDVHSRAPLEDYFFSKTYFIVYTKEYNANFLICIRVYICA